MDRKRRRDEEGTAGAVAEDEVEAVSVEVGLDLQDELLLQSQQEESHVEQLAMEDEEVVPQEQPVVAVAVGEEGRRAKRKQVPKIIHP